jgi:hypothetical protein
MADNKDEGYLDNPTNIRSRNRSGKIIPAKNTEAINPNQDKKIWKYTTIQT